MKEIIQLALRNLTRQKRRSIMLAFAIGFGFFVVTAIDGLASGAVRNLENQITQLVGGTVFIQGSERGPATDKNSKGKLITIIRDSEYVRSLLEKNNIKYSYASQYTSSSGQLLFNSKRVIASLLGRNFNAEPNLVKSFEVLSGDLKNLSRKDALVLSKKAADSLKIQVGDSVLYTTQTINGQNTVGEFTLVAVIKDAGLMSSMFAYVRQDTLDELLEMPENAYDTFSIVLADKKQQNKTAARIEQLIRSDGRPVTSRIDALKTNPQNVSLAIRKQLKDSTWQGTKYTVVSLSDVVPQLNQVLSVVHIVTTIILLVILIIVMIGISNTYRMILYERIREIGTMRALGMTGKDTGMVFTTEALILSLTGAAAGFILGISGMAVFGLFHFNSDTMSFFLNNGHATFVLSPVSTAGQYILMIVLTILAVRGSAKKASTISPAAALRTVK
ncbi:MAG: ABC transporter permease [Treponema sp.]|nr:ABC transporter permease [Treponema sp.]